MTTLDAVIAAAQADLGRPYVYGATGPSAFDCSGLTQSAYRAAGISIPRTSQDQQKFAAPTNSPVPGDLVFWGSPAYHVAIYLGGGKILAAPHSGTVVQIEDLYGSPTYGHVSAAGTGGGTAGASAQGPDAAVTGRAVKSFAVEAVFVTGATALIVVGLLRTGGPQRLGRGIGRGVERVGLLV